MGQMGQIAAVRYCSESSRHRYRKTNMPNPLPIGRDIKSNVYNVCVHRKSVEVDEFHHASSVYRAEIWHRDRSDIFDT